jgi:tetratricopeptide (TPR) repeat protein
MVRPLSATRKYAGVEQDPLTAGREQQADYVLASNYQLAAGKIRITAQLLDVMSGQVEETYKSEKDAGDLFAMQDAVAEEVGNLFLARFAPGSSSPKAVRGTTNEEAYRLYLQAMYLVEKEGRADSKRALELFDQALSLDPNYAKAWAGKARAHCLVAHTGGSTPDAEFAKARPAIERAFALDNNVAEAHAVLGIIKTDYHWNFIEGEKHFLRAIELAPNSDIFYRWYANRLASQGRSGEAIAMAKTAIDLNPNYVVHQIWYGQALYFARRYDDAITQLRRVAEMDSANFLVHYFLWESYHMKGDYPRAYESFMRFQQLIGAKDEVLKSYEAAYVKSGWQAVLLRNLAVLKANNASGSYAYVIAYLSALTGQPDQSFLYLDEAVKNRSLAISNIPSDPTLDSLRGDPRFAELVGRVASQRR